MPRKVLSFAFLLCFAIAPTAISRAETAGHGFTLDSRVALAAYGTAVDARLAGILAAARVLAATEDAKSGDWARIRGPLSILADSEPANSAIWFARPDGSYYSVEKGLTSQNLKQRDYFPQLLAGHDVVGSLVISKSTDLRSVIVASPVFRDGGVIGAIGVSLDVRRLSASLDHAIGFPSGVVFYALDAKGRTALHQTDELIFEFPTEKGSPTLNAAVRTMLAEPAGVVEYIYVGSKRTAVFQRSALTGWVFVVGHIEAPPSD
jgi:methyl-accepting chemotaxis protein